jgi:transcriptional regulator with PAS, ATPase and Fis domain
MEKSNGIKAKAAKLLNIKRTTLVEKMKKQDFAKSA